jgi:hypothetical protein
MRACSGWLTTPLQSARGSLCTPPSGLPVRWFRKHWATGSPDERTGRGLHSIATCRRKQGMQLAVSAPQRRSLRGNNHPLRHPPGLISSPRPSFVEPDPHPSPVLRQAATCPSQSNAACSHRTLLANAVARSSGGARSLEKKGTGNRHRNNGAVVRHLAENRGYDAPRLLLWRFGRCCWLAWALHRKSCKADGWGSGKLTRVSRDV